jgi:hypothetical protein
MLVMFMALVGFVLHSSRSGTAFKALEDTHDRLGTGHSAAQ